VRPIDAGKPAVSDQRADSRDTAIKTAALDKKRLPRLRPMSQPSWPPKALPLTPIETHGRRPLRRFIAALRARAKGRKTRVRVVIYGDSHIAGELLSGRLRRRLQERYGNGGPGFVLLGRPWWTYRRFGVYQSADRKWRSERYWPRYSRRRRRPRDDLYGVAGISTHNRPRHRRIAWVEPRRALKGRAELHYLEQPKGGWFELTTDGKTWPRISTRGRKKAARVHVIKLAQKTRRIEVRVGGGEVRLYGVDLIADDPGVIVDAFGLNGARADVQLKWNESLQKQQLARLNPQLVVLAYGSNEIDSVGLSVKWLEQHYSQVIARIQRMVPKADCLIVGPPDQARYRRRLRWHQPPRLDAIVALQRRLAKRHRCAFWDQRAAMGRGAIFSWVQNHPKLAVRDHVHFTVRGYQLLGEALYTSLLRVERAFRLRKLIKKLP
jgi:lysophospholipase L1-like esterase